MVVVSVRHLWLRGEGFFAGRVPHQCTGTFTQVMSQACQRICLELGPSLSWDHPDSTPSEASAMLGSWGIAAAALACGDSGSGARPPLPASPPLPRPAFTPLLPLPLAGAPVAWLAAARDLACLSRACSS